MSNIMNMKDVKNHVHRSGFDNSRRVCFTAKIGEILPLDWMPVLPGDDITINLNSFGRTAPLQTASFARVREYYDVYFVPYRLLWNQFNDWIKQTDAKSIAKSLTASSDDFDTMPYFTSNDLKAFYDFLGKGAGQALYDDAMMLQKDTSTRLLRYLGYESYISTEDYSRPNQALSPFPLLAYQKIYQDFYRFSQWEDTAPWTCNLDYINSSSQLHLDIASVYSTANINSKNLFRMQYCNYDKDYFHGLLPNAQYGDEAVVSVTGDLSTVATDGDFGTFSFTALPNVSGNTSTLAINPGSSGFTYARVGYNGTGPQQAQLGNAKFEDGRIAFDNSFSADFSILALRRQECLQKWKEITMSGDTDYVSQLAKHWNVSVPSALSQRCQYLGGTANNLDISEVINTNLTGENAQADIYGKGTISNNGHIKFRNPSNDYGILMVMYHCKPIIEWKSSSVRARSLTAVHKTDFPIPEFDSIGMEQVFLHEFYNQSDISSYQKDIAGYAPRYIDYKTSFDIVKGEFEDSLESWCLPYDLDKYFLVSGVGYVDYRAFKVTPTIGDNLFGVSARVADQFYNSLYLDIKSVRNLSRDGLPY